MAALVLTDPQFSIATVDLTDWVKSLRITYQADAPEITASGDDPREYLGGLKNWSMEVELNQDRDASAVDATMFDIVGTVVAVTAKATDAATSATNPEYQGDVVVTSYQPIGGSIGEVETTPITLQGTGTLTRAVA